jgi:hypothetical protein
MHGRNFVIVAVIELSEVEWRGCRSGVVLKAEQIGRIGYSRSGAKFLDSHNNLIQFDYNMTTMLGKRKREIVKVSKRQIETQRNQESAESDTDSIDAQEIFRRHFEAQYAPLPEVPKKVKIVQPTTDDESEEETDWDGISDDENGGVQVIEHTDAQLRMAAMSKEQLKSFMVRTRILPLDLSDSNAEL